MQNGQVERSLCISDEAFEVRFTDRTDRVDVCARAVVLCEVAAQAGVDGGGREGKSQ